ncbi:unnamed protein product [Adineta ricciae]|uniref:Glycosyl hydrolase family 13 catalytic domain-containing protein n=1 Tax=Adineta ricciae TaxID=249248 RepID=A0A815C7G4_ADIRI|nr:unnamed protein product [Adineta ricciae]
MSEKAETTSSVVVPDDVHQSLLTDGSDVQTKVGPVAKFHRDGEERDLETIDELVGYKKAKINKEFVGLTKEELKEYINNPKWKRIRWIIAFLYILILLLLLIGSIVLIVTSQRCPPKPHLHWFEKEIIYEIDVPFFRDSNQDGIGDIKGVEEKLKYFEKNRIKSLLFQSSIFNATGGISLQLDGRIPHDKNIDLITLDSSIGSENDFENFIKILNRKDMRLIIDLPLSSTLDPNGQLWYGSKPLRSSIANPCSRSRNDLACRFLEFYGRLPLDFNDAQIYEESEIRIKYWLTTKKVDGIRVNLPLEYVSSTGSYNISYSTIQKWNDLKNDIEKKSKSKLLIYDIPFGLQNFITDDDLNSKTAHSLYLSNGYQRQKIDASKLYRRIDSFKEKTLSKPKFWQLGSKRRSDEIGILTENQLKKEMLLTITMLLGGTPIVLYGEEIGLDQKVYPIMSWSPDDKSRGFSNCSTKKCLDRFLNYSIDPSKTSVKRQEALGGESKDSLLNVFRHLAQIRLSESFQHGIVQTGCDQQSNLFWFIREAPGHRGFIVLLNLNENTKDFAHIALNRLTDEDVPLSIHNEYQWPKYTLPRSNTTHIDSDNLLIDPQSINIFSWAPKMIKPDVLYERAKQHQHKC